MSMDAGGLAQMTYNNFSSGGFGAPGSGYGSRGKAANVKRLSVALPPKVNSIHEDQIDNPTPRTSRSHLLAGLRTAPKSGNGPASAPFTQPQNQFSGYESYNQGVPQSAMGAGFGANQYVMNAGQQTYSLPEQVLAPPSFYGQDDEMDPNVLNQLQMTGMFLAQRQQQLQQQLASITAAANQFQGMNLNGNNNGNYLQQSASMSTLPQYGQQQIQGPIEVPGQPGLYLVYNPATGQYQYAQDNTYEQPTQQRAYSPASNGQSNSLSRGNSLSRSTSHYDVNTPVFRAEVSPPPGDKPSRSITPPKKTSSPQIAMESVEPLPPPSANAFRRGHKKASSLAFSSLVNGPSDGPKTASLATVGTARTVFPPTPMTGTFGPGNARAGEHPTRQPRGPPSLDELVALPTTKHEGSKNFATRQRRAALSNLMRAGSVRRGASAASSPTSETDSLHFSEEDEPGFRRKQSPIGSERSVKRGSMSSFEGFGTGSAVNTPASEKGNAFDSFVKQLPTSVQQGQQRKKMMLGVLTAAEKRKSMF